LTNGYIKVLKMGLAKPETPNIFINGGHHARELTSIQMVCYMILRLIYEYEEAMASNGNDILLSFLQNHNLIFVPVVNLDGFHEINELWKK